MFFGDAAWCIAVVWQMGFICDECLQKPLAKQDVSFGIAKSYLLRSNRYGFAVSNDTFCNVISYVFATICCTDGYEKDGSGGVVVKLLDKKRWGGRLCCGDARFIVVAQSRGSFPLLAWFYWDACDTKSEETGSVESLRACIAGISMMFRQVGWQEKCLPPLQAGDILS